MAALLCTEKITGAANLEVAHCDFETASEAGVLFNGTDAFADVAEQRGMSRQKKIRVGLVLVAANAAAELVKVAQSETIRAINDDGVGVRNIDAAFNDGGRDENVRLAVDELGH